MNWNCRTSQLRRLSFLLVVAPLCLGASPWSLGDEPCCGNGSGKSTQRQALDPQAQESAIAAAKQFAAALAGGDDAAYVELFEGALGVAAGSVEQTGSRSTLSTPMRAPNVLAPEQSIRRRVELRASPESIWLDKTYLKNYRKLIEDNGIPRILGGNATDQGEFPDCVAVGSNDQWCCTGTLIAPQLVITAGHCYPRCVSRIFVGLDVDQPDSGKIVKVRTAIRHPGYVEVGTDLIKNDLTLLILETAVENVVPRKIATAAVINSAAWCRAVGFGTVDRLASFGYGIQRKVDIAIASPDCGGDAPTRYGCNAGFEIVAGGAGKDSCAGDSGGPIYIRSGDVWYLAGATSRATKEWRLSGAPCGEGGSYVRVDQYLNWAREVATGNSVAGP